MKKQQISSESEDSDQKIEVRKKTEYSSLSGSHAHLQRDAVKRSTKKLEFPSTSEGPKKHPAKTKKYTDSSSDVTKSKASKPENVIPKRQPMLSSSQGSDKVPLKKQKEASSGSDEELTEKRKIPLNVSSNAGVTNECLRQALVLTRRLATLERSASLCLGPRAFHFLSACGSLGAAPPDLMKFTHINLTLPNVTIHEQVF